MTPKVCNIKLNLPSCKVSIKETTPAGGYSVFDITRKQWVALTPEEWVRQHFIHYLVNYKSTPMINISTEQHFLFTNGKPQRADMVIYNSKGQPYILVECKAPHIKITSTTFEQATRYNAYIKANYIIITNGLSHHCAHTEDFINYTIQNEIPCFK